MLICISTSFQLSPPFGQSSIIPLFQYSTTPILQHSSTPILKLPQETYVTPKEELDIINAIFEHGNSLNPHAKGKS